MAFESCAMIIFTSSVRSQHNFQFDHTRSNSIVTKSAIDRRRAHIACQLLKYHIGKGHVTAVVVSMAVEVTYKSKATGPVPSIHKKASMHFSNAHFQQLLQVFSLQQERIRTNSNKVVCGAGLCTHVGVSV